MDVEQRVKKYWIKPGKEVAHREFPARKMIVEEILKKSERMMIDGSVVEKQFIIGVDCHWFDENGRYDRGKFLTTELIEFGKKPKLDSKRFSSTIPSSDTSNVL